MEGSLSPLLVFSLLLLVHESLCRIVLLPNLTVVPAVGLN